ncbi:hypothetical protein O181_018458 [Austropuccinia psidii MF-1]|uniref:Uncharacterized protein n=1 Tax=Austropuccinia psidii MF-1 TaxID=1389203 RepID=A0A9Q3C7X9_9BASI|nr:hypothetical protein [Austropuccinia psidii MF-1]
MLTQADEHQPPDHLVDRLGASCFHCGCPAHWRADFPHTRDMANPHPRSPLPTPFYPARPATPDRHSQQNLGVHYQWERVSQVHFVKHGESDKVLIDTGASIHLSGALCFPSHMHPVFPFRIFFADSNSSILVMQMTTLRPPVKNGMVIVQDVAYSDKITGTILSVGHLFTLGIVPVFDELALLLFVSGFPVTTTFSNNCWWLDVLSAEGTKGLVAVTPSNSLSSFEMNPISHPSTMSLNSCECMSNLATPVIRQ